MSATGPTSTPMFRTVTVWTALALAALAVLASLLGFLIGGGDGLLSALSGVAVAAVFLILTPLSMLIANRWYGRDNWLTLFFGIVMGSWLLKFVLFFFAILLLRGQPWLNPVAFFLALVAGIFASLAIDVYAYTKLRVPYTGEVLLPSADPDSEDS